MPGEHFAWPLSTRDERETPLDLAGEGGGRVAVRGHAGWRARAVQA